MWRKSRTPRVLDDGKHRPVQPWGDRPPPAPATATRKEHKAVKSAWNLWSPFRPWYYLEGDLVEVLIDLKGNTWCGSARAPKLEDAAWAALQSCIDNYWSDFRWANCWTTIPAILALGRWPSYWRLHKAQSLADPPD
jgi:hypothetical protein